MQPDRQHRPTHPLGSCPGRQALRFAFECQDGSCVEPIDLPRAAAGRRVAVFKAHSTHGDLVAAVALTVPVTERRAFWRGAYAEYLQAAELLSGEFKFFHDLPLIGGNFLEQKVLSNPKVPVTQLLAIFSGSRLSRQPLSAEQCPTWTEHQLRHTSIGVVALRSDQHSTGSVRRSSTARGSSDIRCVLCR